MRGGFAGFKWLAMLSGRSAFKEEAGVVDGLNEEGRNAGKEVGGLHEGLG
jgi:hypothetical protein